MRAGSVVAVLMHICCTMAKLSLSDLKSIQSRGVYSGFGGVVIINPNGPLNLLRGYIYKRLGLMNNMRFFSPGIKVSYELTANEKKDVNGNMHIFKRELVKDKAYQTNSSTKKEKYLSEYHKRIILMFPSTHGTLSIETGREDSFIRLIRHESVKQHAPYILAALCLLAEGVDVQLQLEKVDAGRMLVLKNKSGSKTYFRINMTIEKYNMEKGIVEYSYQSEAAEIVRFFTKNVDMAHQKEYKEFTLPDSLEQLETGTFLYGMQFLVQTYIFEVIHEVEDAFNLIRAAEALLCDQISYDKKAGTKEENRIAEAVFAKCFAPVDISFEAGRPINTVQILQSTIEKYKVCPFLDAEELPINMRIQLPAIDANANRNRLFQTYSDCAETGMLVLLCCLTYDQNTQTYETKHIRDLPSALENFFAIYSTPFNGSDLKVHMEWSSVVTFLNESGVAYKHGGHEVISGILNFLLAVSAVTGRTYIDRHAISRFLQEIADSPVPRKNFLSDVSEFTENMLMQLSLNKDVQISCRNLSCRERTDKVQDVFGEIILRYKGCSGEDQLTIWFDKGHTNVSYVPGSRLTIGPTVERIVAALDIDRIKSKASTFIDYLVIHYITKTVEEIYNQSEESIPDSAIKQLINNEREGITRIFMHRKIQDTKYKSKLVACTAIHGVELPLTSEDISPRFITNILGSVLLGDKKIQSIMLPSLIYIGAQRDLYPYIQLKIEDYESIADSTTEHINILTHVLDTGSDTVLMRCLKILITIPNSYSFAYASNEMRGVLKRIFTQLFANNSTQNAAVIKRYLESSWGLDKIMTKKILYALYVYVCEEKGEMPGLISAVYDLLPNWGSSIFLKCSMSKDKYTTVLNILKKKKEVMPAAEQDTGKIGNLLTIFMQARTWPPEKDKNLSFMRY
ncbi:hypothetical protein NEAUS05_0020 [Nematocida ausubeli]|nr:hypothetical protein NEAUS06_0774 [Nematocida ausubeli]KAI5134082.1 hypothetical protein NEAUS07_0695 [Nematocida ausubeli]KAI5146572.1 hypothetical protein NEAUS05_0020 [Nematocida ausubeli]